MRICFELLELLKAHKKSIRRAAINTFGYIAKVKLGFFVTNMKIDLRPSFINMVHKTRRTYFILNPSLKAPSSSSCLFELVSC